MGTEMSRILVSIKGANNKIEPRDVSPMIQKAREILLGRKYIKHNRFEPFVSPRSIPPPDIPHRGPDPKYFDRYYFNRHAMNSVKPPVVADLSRMKLSQRPGGKCEGSPSSVPTPGDPWWWDGHCYYEERCQNVPAKK